MKLGKILIYLLILVVVAGWLYIVEIRYRPGQKEQEDRGKKIVHLEKDKIVQIGLDSRERGKVEVQKPGDTWVLTAPVRTKADKLAVDSLLASITDATSEKVVLEKDVKWDDYGLDKPDFTVTVSTPDKKTDIFFGASNPAKTSYYVRVDDDPRLLLCADTLKISLNKSAFDLRDKAVVNIAPEDLEKIVISRKGKQIELRREGTDKWFLETPRRFRVKSSVVNADLRTITNLKAKAIIDPPLKDIKEYGLEKPEETILLYGPKKELTFLVGKPQGDKSQEKKPGSEPEPDRYALIKGHDTVYVLDGRSLSSVRTDPEELRDRSVLLFSPPDIEKVEIELDGKQWAAAKGKDNKWTLEKPEKKERINNWAISGILWDVKDLQWQSMTVRKPNEPMPPELEHPRLVVSLFKKGDETPLILKAGWKDEAAKAGTQPEKVEDQKGGSAAKQPLGTNKDRTPAKDQSKAKAESKPEPQAPSVVAIAQPSEDEGATYTLDGGFAIRIQQDLQRITEEK